MIAAYNKNQYIVSELLRGGAELEARDELGRTAVLCAAVAGRKAQLARLVEAGASLRVETFERRRILELAAEAKSFGTLELLLRRHEIALLEKPPYFLFTRRTSGKALQFALEKNMFSRGVNIQGVDILFRHFEKAKEYQRKHLQGRSAELRQIWNQGLETTPEDEEPYELGWQEATGAEGENARQKLQELESRLNTAYATEQALKGALFGKRQSDERCPKRPEIFPAQVTISPDSSSSSS